MYSTYYKTTKKKTVAKLKVTRKLEDILPAFILFSYHGITIKRSYPHSNFFSYTPPSTNWIISTIFQIYRRFLHFYRRFFIISTVRHRISTYRQFSAIYLYSIPRHYNKKKLPSQQLLSHIPHPVPTGLYQRFFKYIGDFYTFMGDFFIISTIRHRISTYRHPSTLKTHNIPYPQAIYCRTLRLKR